MSTVATLLAIGLGAGGITHAVAYTPDVASGTTVTGEVLSSGQIQLVHGVANSTTANWGGLQKVYGRTDSTILNGGVQIVSSGGLASATVVNSAGSQRVSSGGVATATLVNSGGRVYVSSGGTANGTTVSSGGSMSIYSGAVASGTILNAGAIQSVVGVENGAAVNSGAEQRVYGLASGSIVSGGSQIVYGFASAASVKAGGYQYVYGALGIIAEGTILDSGGSQTVGSGAIARATIVNNGGLQLLSNGAYAGGTTVNAGGVQTVSSGASAGRAVINSAGLQSVRGGSVNDTVVNSAGVQTVAAGGSAVGASINAGAMQIVSSGGIANATLVNSGGSQTIIAGGSAVGAAVNAGGVQAISAGGMASSTTVSSGGKLHVHTGGVVNHAEVGNGGIITVSSGGSSFYTQIRSGGLEVIQSGGYGPSATVYAGGTQTIEAGGLDSASTILSGGSQVVAGTARGATISGSQIIQQGGSGIDGVVKSGGSVTASSGSVLLGYQIEGGGASLGAAGIVSASSNGGLAILVSGSSNSVTLNGAQLGASVKFAGSGNTLSIQNGTTLTGAVALTDSTKSNALTLSNQVLTLADSPTPQAAEVAGWQTFNIGSNAMVDLAGNAVSLAVGTLSNGGTLTVGANQALTVKGNYSQTGTLAVGLTSPSTYGKVAIAGNAALSETARILIASGSVLEQGATYGNVFRADGSTMGAFVSNGTYGLLQYKIMSNGTGFDLVTDGSSTTPAEVGLTPLLNGRQVMVTLNQAQASLQVIRDRMEHIEPAYYQDTVLQKEAWITPFANIGSQSSDGNPSAAYRQKTGGLAFGVDAPFGEDLRLGIAATIANTDVTGRNLSTRDNLATTSYQLTGYAKYAFDQGSQLRFIINGALDQNQSSRLATANGISQNASASYGGWHGVLSAEANHRWQFGGTTLTPLVRLDYGHARVNPYNENGTYSANLNVSAQSGRSLVAGAGGRARYEINERSHVQVRALVGYDFAAKANALTATDVNGISFTAIANQAGPLVMQAGVSYEIVPAGNEGLRLRASYDYIGRNKGQSNNMINFNLIVPF